MVSPDLGPTDDPGPLSIACHTDSMAELERMVHVYVDTMESIRRRSGLPCLSAIVRVRRYGEEVGLSEWLAVTQRCIFRRSRN